MTILKSKSLLLSACALGVIAFSADASAQTANMTATAEVQNTLTLATPTQLNFGTIAAARDAALTASVTVETDGTSNVASGGGTAVTAIVDATSILPGQVTIADGADAAIINVTIDNVVDPSNGPESFVLGDFETSFNGAAAAPQVVGTPFPVTFDAAVGPNLNTLDIGATITTTLGAGTSYTDGTYAGTYDVIFSY